MAAALSLVLVPSVASAAEPTTTTEPPATTTTGAPTTTTTEAPTTSTTEVMPGQQELPFSWDEDSANVAAVVTGLTFGALFGSVLFRRSAA